MRCNLREQATQEGAVSQSPQEDPTGAVYVTVHSETVSSRIALAPPNLVFTVPSQLRVLLVYASLTSNTNAPRCQAFHRSAA